MPALAECCSRVWSLTARQLAWDKGMPLLRVQSVQVTARVFSRPAATHWWGGSRAAARSSTDCMAGSSKHTSRQQQQQQRCVRY